MIKQTTTNSITKEDLDNIIQDIVNDSSTDKLRKGIIITECTAGVKEPPLITIVSFSVVIEDYSSFPFLKVVKNVSVDMSQITVNRLREIVCEMVNVSNKWFVEITSFNAHCFPLR